MPELVESWGAATGLDQFLASTSDELTARGFHPDECLAVTATCRDELLAPLRATVRAHWHRSFDLSTLSGVPLAGSTGAAAALSHAPASGDRVRLVVFAMPHIGRLPDGTWGHVLRRGQGEPTTACGSLAAARQWAAAADRAGAAPPWDPRDPEQSFIRNRLLQVDPHLAERDLPAVTELARQVMADDLWDLFRAGPAPVDLALVSATVVHTSDGDVVPDGVRVRLLDGPPRTKSRG